MSKNNSHYRSMPKTVRIGCFDYDVDVIEGDAGEIGGFYGAHNSVRKKIVICAGLDPQQAANTFLHEVIHGIHVVYGLREGSSEEEFTAYTTNGLCAFWQDNPEATRWWQRAISRAQK